MVAAMVTWGDFVRQEPDLAARGGELLYQYGVGLAFLSTVRADMGPRLHPMCPLLTEEGLFAFIIPSPKQRDLRRDGRFAMHSFPCENNEDAFYLTGRASLIEQPATRQALAQQFVDERSDIGVEPPAAEDALFEFDLSRCLVTKTTGHGDPAPRHLTWSVGSP